MPRKATSHRPAAWISPTTSVFRSRSFRLRWANHGYVRGVLAGCADIGDGVLTGAVDKTWYEDPWLLDEDLALSKIFVGYGFWLGLVRAQVALQAYTGRWHATDQIPRRAVRDGWVSRTGYIDPDLGGETDTARIRVVVHP